MTIKIFQFEIAQEEGGNYKGNFVFCRMLNSSKSFKVYQLIHYYSKTGIVNEFPDGRVRREK